jgi:Domain of unknown function (DUF3336)
LRENLRRATSYSEWKAAAADLDQYLSNDLWREDDEFAYYDYELIGRVTAKLRKCRLTDNMEELRGVLEICVKGNFGISGQSILQYSSQPALKILDFIARHILERNVFSRSILMKVTSWPFDFSIIS